MMEGNGMKLLKLKKMPDLPFNMVEALNQLRINLSFCGDQMKTIMITSSLPNEGKSFLTVQLWKMMAELGTSTLLIDCDLRNSEMRSKYRIGNSEGDKMQGLVHYLAGSASLQEVLHRTNIPNGYMIPAAASVANPTILLEGPRFAPLLEGCAKSFDCVLIDTPPLGSVADAMNISTHCDGTVLVVRSGETPRKIVSNSVQLLKRTETPMLGIVLNRADTSKKSNYYYNRYYRYGYYKGYGYGYGYGYGNKSKQKPVDSVISAEKDKTP